MNSVHNLVSGQPLQAGAVGLPVLSGECGCTSIVVEVYALGIGVTFVGQGSDLGSTEGTLELEANGKRAVIDPLRCRKAEWFVTPIERDIAAIGLKLQTVDQDQLSQLGDCVAGAHGTPCAQAKTAILSLPAGSGKTTIAARLAAFLGCRQIVDEWSPTQPITPFALHLTNVSVGGGAA